MKYIQKQGNRVTYELKPTVIEQFEHHIRRSLFNWKNFEVKCRTILWHMVFWGFVINYMFCINMFVTIVDMVATPSEQQEQQLTENVSATLDIVKRSIAENFTTTEQELIQKSNKFEWNQYQQGLILGSFFWLHWVPQIPSGIWAQRYGTKVVFGLSNVISCWICFFIPTAAYHSAKALIILRALQGLIGGFTWPAMHVLIARWIPPDERSKFVTAYFGSSIGAAISYPLFAYIMHYISWQWVYHICGFAGTIWWLGWLFLVYDSPAQHPRISVKELTYIENALGSSVQQETRNAQTPWKAILTSRPVWMNVIGTWAGMWGLFTLMTQTPTYFKVIHNWDTRTTGILSGIPHIMRMVFAYGFSLYCDYLLRTNKMELTNLRKFATAIGSIVMGLVVLALAYFGHNAIWAIVFISAAVMLQGAGSSGFMSSMIDIAPNYAGIIFGFCGTIGCIPGFVSAYLVGILTLDNQTFEAWTNVFLICAAVLIVCGILYVVFADSSLQTWNDYAQYNAVKDIQMVERNCDFKGNVLAKS
ncbi:sialin-like [Cochliomyia hominivorax]